MKIANLQSKPTITYWLLIFFIFISQKSSSARNLGSSHQHHHHNHHKITFYMQDVLNFNASHLSPKTTELTSHQLPFPKPLGLFPPNGGIPISESNPATTGSSSSSTQTLDVSNIGILFPAKATLQELEFGTLVVIDEDLFAHHSLNDSPRLGKAQGIYVASSEDGTSHMMAMTASFSDTGGFMDGLRLFGAHRKDGAESHIAVIGGTGKYDGANGYATVKAVHAGSNNIGGQAQEANDFLLFNVYLS